MSCVIHVLQKCFQSDDTLRLQTLMAVLVDSCPIARFKLLKLWRCILLVHYLYRIIRVKIEVLQPDDTLKLQTLMVGCVVSCTFC